MTSRRPTLDDIRHEQMRFIGPPAPPLIPKLTPEAEREAVQAMLLDDLITRIAAETNASRDSRHHFLVTEAGMNGALPQVDMPKCEEN